MLLRVLVVPVVPHVALPAAELLVGFEPLRTSTTQVVCSVLVLGQIFVGLSPVKLNLGPLVL